jgi:hypothetical protein
MMHYGNRKSIDYTLLPHEATVTFAKVNGNEVIRPRRVWILIN